MFGTSCHIYTLKKVSQQTRGVDPMLFLCCADAEDGGPPLKQHCVNSSCLLGIA